MITDAFCIEEWTITYTLSESLENCQLEAVLHTTQDGPVRLEVTDGAGMTVAAGGYAKNGQAVLTCVIDQPRLWYPTGYGDPVRYTVTACTLHSDQSIADLCMRPVGFRRVRLVMNEGSRSEGARFPKFRLDAPITLEINGRRMFAKGSNWVNAQVFPGEMTTTHYEQLLDLVKDAHMNLLRVWGGGFINKESFYDLCDEKGIMVWQEFPLACNEYPDDERYLAILEQEATSIVRRLRTHPCVVIWCGGNELFNSWSQMTEQHHALRLLDAICYAEDRHTPFLMTSPLGGMQHGHYVNYDENIRKESFTVLREAHGTAYTEFGCPGMPSRDYLARFMSMADLEDCRPENLVWREHHGFGAWWEEAWIRRPEIAYFFEDCSGVEELCEKSGFIQQMCYRSMFEEVRRQWPHCSMALNWCLNEPWPTCANNSLISWPAEPRPAYYAVKEALRPQMVSLGIERQLWYSGESFQAEIWILNDSLERVPGSRVKVSYSFGASENIWGTLHFSDVPAQCNQKCGVMVVPLPQDWSGTFHVFLRVDNHVAMDSTYTYLCRRKQSEKKSGLLNM